MLLAGPGWADTFPGRFPCEGLWLLDGIGSICGLVAPEDIEVLPGGRYLVFSQMHARAAGGNLARCWIPAMTACGRFIRRGRRQSRSLFGLG